MTTQVSTDSLNCDPSKTKPEWLRIPEAIRIFGIGRSTLYILIGEGKVKSCSLRRRGAVRGIRLISYDSLSAFIEDQSAKSPSR
jgi:Helix-turn-helix domain